MRQRVPVRDLVAAVAFGLHPDQTGRAAPVAGDMGEMVGVACCLAATARNPIVVLIRPCPHCRGDTRRSSRSVPRPKSSPCGRGDPCGLPGRAAQGRSPRSGPIPGSGPDRRTRWPGNGWGRRRPRSGQRWTVRQVVPLGPIALWSLGGRGSTGRVRNRSWLPGVNLPGRSNQSGRNRPVQAAERIQGLRCDSLGCSRAWASSRPRRPSRTARRPLGQKSGQAILSGQ